MFDPQTSTAVCTCKHCGHRSEVDFQALMYDISSICSNLDCQKAFTACLEDRVTALFEFLNDLKEPT